jgi:hypothetical protein
VTITVNYGDAGAADASSFGAVFCKPGAAHSWLRNATTLAVVQGDDNNGATGPTAQYPAAGLTITAGSGASAPTWQASATAAGLWGVDRQTRFASPVCRRTGGDGSLASLDSIAGLMDTCPAAGAISFQMRLLDTPNVRTAGNAYVLWSKHWGSYDTERISLSYEDGGTLSFRVAGATGGAKIYAGEMKARMSDPSTFLGYNPWHHVVVTWNTTPGTGRGTQEIWIDGMLMQTTSTAFTVPANSPSAFYLGGPSKTATATVLQTVFDWRDFVAVNYQPTREQILAMGQWRTPMAGTRPYDRLAASARTAINGTIAPTNNAIEARILLNPFSGNVEMYYGSTSSLIKRVALTGSDPSVAANWSAATLTGPGISGNAIPTAHHHVYVFDVPDVAQKTMYLFHGNTYRTSLDGAAWSAESGQLVGAAPDGSLASGGTPCVIPPSQSPDGKWWFIGECGITVSGQNTYTAHIWTGATLATLVYLQALPASLSPNGDASIVYAGGLQVVKVGSWYYACYHAFTTTAVTPTFMRMAKSRDLLTWIPMGWAADFALSGAGGIVGTDGITNQTQLGDFNIYTQSGTCYVTFTACDASSTVNYVVMCPPFSGGIERLWNWVGQGGIGVVPGIEVFTDNETLPGDLSCDAIHVDAGKTLNLSGYTLTVANKVLQGSGVYTNGVLAGNYGLAGGIKGASMTGGTLTNYPAGVLEDDDE